MKTFTVFVVVLAFALAEPPPSNSYLPPSPNGRNGGGYPSGPAGQGGAGALPQVIAARNLGGAGGQGGFGGHSHQHGQHGNNGFARNGAQGQGYPQGGAQGGAQARFGDQAHGGYDQNANALSRNALEELNGEPASYNFEYMVNDYQQGTDFGHHEEREDESAHGEYHVVLPDGRKQTVSYEADERGFKPRISYQDTDLARSGGYDANANNIDQHGGQSHGNHGDHANHGDHGNHGNGFNARSTGY